VNSRKSAVDHPWNRKFLGFTVSRNEAKLKVADQAIEKLKARIRELTRRTRGHRLLDVVAELRETLLGWKAYFGIAEVLSPLRDIDKWIRRKLRCYHWKQWGRAGYRELRRRGFSVREAWHTSKSARRTVAPVENSSACASTPGAILSQFGVAEFGSEMTIYFIEPPCT
jgi:RNA-directed DNA polymerase